MNIINIKSLIATSVLTCVISSCTSSPKQMVIAPEVNTTISNAYQQKFSQLSVKDLRTKTHIIEIIKEGSAAEIISSSTSLGTVIQSKLVNAFKRNSLQISPNVTNHLVLQINKAEVNVEQSLMKYTANNVISLTVSVQSGERTLTKSYQTKGNSDGALTADIAVLERDFNQQLGKLLTKVVMDSEIQNFLK